MQSFFGGSIASNLQKRPGTEGKASKRAVNGVDGGKNRLTLSKLQPLP